MRQDREVEIIRIDKEIVSTRYGIPYIDLEYTQYNPRSESIHSQDVVMTERYKAKIFTFCNIDNGYTTERHIVLDKETEEIVDLYSSDIRRELNREIDTLNREIRLEKSKTWYLKLIEAIKNIIFKEGGDA